MSCERDLAFTWIVVLKKKSKIEPKGSSVIESVRCESVTCEPIRQANQPLAAEHFDRFRFAADLVPRLRSVSALRWVLCSRPFWGLCFG